MNEKIIDRIDTLLEHGEGGGTAAEVTPTLASTASEEGFEDSYQKIGWWKGPNATPEVRAFLRNFWQRQGDRGLRWLLVRLRGEWHIDVLDGVSSILSQAGGTGILPILEGLERRPQRDQAEALLQALGWMGEDGVRVDLSSAERLETALSRFVELDDSDLREWAARAVRLLPPEQVVRLLANRLDVEPDADVRQAIEETVAAGEIGRA